MFILSTNFPVGLRVVSVEPSCIDLPDSIPAAQNFYPSIFQGLFAIKIFLDWLFLAVSGIYFFPASQYIRVLYRHEIAYLGLRTWAAIVVFPIFLKDLLLRKNFCSVIFFVTLCIYSSNRDPPGGADAIQTAMKQAIRGYKCIL